MFGNKGEGLLQACISSILLNTSMSCKICSMSGRVVSVQTRVEGERLYVCLIYNMDAKAVLYVYSLLKKVVVLSSFQV